MAEKKKSAVRRVWDVTNEVVKSPLFVFLIGGSFIAFLPRIEEWRLTPADRDARRLEQQERADAVLIAPFLANLSATEPGRYRASAAALQALEKASKGAHDGKSNPMFEGVNSAITAVARELWPQPAVTGEDTKILDKQATPASPTALNANPGNLEKALVYIQVDGKNASSLSKAEELSVALHQKSILSPEIQKMSPDTIPNQTQVRYFNDEDRASAEALAALVMEKSGSMVFTVKPKLKANQGTLEVWFGKR
jgi:hypothetical protein